MRMMTIVLLAALALHALASEVPTGSVRGVIYNEVGRPESQALVMVIGTEHRAYTDDSGQFQIDRIPAGHRYFLITHPYMNQATFDLTIAGADTATIRPIYLRPFGLSDSLAAAESIGVDVPWAANALTCAIRPTQSILHVGDEADFQVSITNHSKQSLALVYPLDGSGGGRFPNVWIHVELLTMAPGHILPSDGRFLKGHALLSCGNTSGIYASDFVPMGPGQTIDPYAREPKPAIAPQTFVVPGTYRATFRYSTKQPDVRRWAGFGQSSLDPGVSKMLRTVPMVELSASTEFEVRE
jgi:hypothetical protein